MTFLGLHDVPRFMNEPGATTDGLRLAFTFLMTARGTPLVYYGDEIAMPGGGDPDNRRDFPGGLAGRSRGTPSRRKVGLRTRSASSRTCNGWRGFARRSRPCVAAAMVDLAVGEQTWVYARVYEGRAAVVALNNGQAGSTLDAATGPLGLAEGARLVDLLGGPGVRVEDRSRADGACRPAAPRSTW